MGQKNYFKIIELKAENIKKLKAVEIKPTSNVVKISGDNAQGKTSILDSIVYALGGKKYIPEDVLRKGEEKGIIQIKLDNGLSIERSFTSKGTYLKVTSEDGGKYGQEKLSGMVEGISFDPFAFKRLSDKEQKELLMKIAGLEEKLSELKDKRALKYEERTLVGRLKEQLKGEVESYTQKEPVVKVNVSKISEELQAIQEVESKRNTLNKSISLYKQEIEKNKAEIERLLGVNKIMEESLSTEENMVKELPITEQEKIEGLKAELSSATEKNNQAFEYENYVASKKKYDEQSSKYKVLTAEVEAIDKEGLDLIKNSKMPIEGLGFDSKGVTYNGIQFSQLSSSEQIKVSLAIAMAMNPELRVIRIMDGSLLGTEAMKEIEKMAYEKDYSVWIEIVDTSKQVGFYIEEGEVKAINNK